MQKLTARLFYLVNVTSKSIQHSHCSAIRREASLSYTCPAVILQKGSFSVLNKSTGAQARVNCVNFGLVCATWNAPIDRVHIVHFAGIFG